MNNNEMMQKTMNETVQDFTAETVQDFTAETVQEDTNETVQKSTNPKDIITGATDKLYKIYNLLNEKYYESSLPNVIITIQESKGKYYGWFASNRWSDAEGEETVHEINMTPEFLTRSLEAIFCTMNHEMVHLYCHLNEIQDTSNLGRYHNKRFKQVAESKGLIVQKSEKTNIGWSATTATEEFAEFVQNSGIEDEFTYFRKMDLKKTGSSSSKVSKYVCPTCGMKFSAKKGLNIVCGECDEPLDEIE